MPITFAIAPTANDIVLSGSKVPVRVIVPDVLTQSTNPQNAYLIFTRVIADATPVAISYNGNTLSFLCYDSDDNGYIPGYSLPQAHGRTLEEMMPLYVAGFKSNYGLARDYNIFYLKVGSQHRLYFSQYELSDDYDLTITVNAFPVPFTVVESVLQGYDLQNSHRTGIQVFEYFTDDVASGYKPSSRPLEIQTRSAHQDISEEDYNLEGYVEAFMDKLLREEINGHFTFPHVAGTFIYEWENVIKMMRFAAYQKYLDDDGDFTEHDVAFSDAFYVLQGKLTEDKQAALNDASKSFTQYFLERNMFVTWAPLTRTIDIYTPVFLYWIAQQANITLKTTIYYTDGTNATSTLKLLEEVTPYSMVELNVSLLNLPLTVGKTPLKYTIWLENALNNVISEIRTFEISYKYQSYARYFLFKNSLGAYEVIRTTGKAEKISNIDKTIISTDLPVNFGRTDRSMKQIDQSPELTVQINSGILTAAESEYFVEFLESSDVYWLRGGIAYPVVIDKSKTSLGKDGENINSHNFIVMAHDIKETYYNDFSINPEAPIPGPFSFDFSEGFDS